MIALEIGGYPPIIISGGHDIMKTIAALILASIIAAGCSTAQRPDAETVGQLISIDGSSYRKPVHATTDLSTPALVTPGGSADDSFTVTGAAELPEVSPKSGLTMGTVRQ
jgi:hypothetical protein